MPGEIADYALIGDCETAALVGRDGSIDWLCMPRFDSPACFAALLGSPENGRWQLKPTGSARTVRRYRPHALILETVFQTADGQVTIIDFMPRRLRNPRVVRIVRGDRGTVRMQLDLTIRFDYGLTVPWVTRRKDGSLLAVAGPHQLILRTPVPLRGKDLHTVALFTVKTGQTVPFQLQYGDSFQTLRSHSDLSPSLKSCETFWRK